MGEKSINQYKNLQDFINEYDDLYHGELVEKLIGIDFKYKDNFYRMCKEPISEDLLPTKDGKICHICTYKNTTDMFLDSDVQEWYFDLYDCLENWIIEGIKFKNVISDPDTMIVDQD